MREAASTSDNELLCAASNDPEAFGQFYDRHAIALLGALRYRTGSAEIALDVTAEVFAQALEHCAKFQPTDEHSARAWLYRIARNRLVDYYRRGTAENHVCARLGIRAIELDQSATEAIDRRLDAAASGVLKALAELPADERAAVTARVIQENDYATIADRHKVSESVIRKRVSRGLRRLRLSVKEES